MVLVDAERRRTPRCATSSIATARPGRLRQGDVRPGAATSSGEKEKLDMILRNIEPVPGRRTTRTRPPTEPAGGQLLVVLVRQRIRGAGLLPEAAGRGPIPRARWPRGWSSTCSTTASTPPTGTRTRDTRLCIEALADYLKASGEDKPDMTVEVWLDGKMQKEVEITPANLFSFDNKLRAGRRRSSTTGKHTRRARASKGTRPALLQRAT